VKSIVAAAAKRDETYPRNNILLTSGGNRKIASSKIQAMARNKKHEKEIRNLRVSLKIVSFLLTSDIRFTKLWYVISRLLKIAGSLII
jgi:hypothetical protein